MKIRALEALRLSSSITIDMYGKSILEVEEMQKIFDKIMNSFFEGIVKVESIIDLKLNEREIEITYNYIKDKLDRFKTCKAPEEVINEFETLLSAIKK